MKKILYLLILIISVFISNNLIRSTYNLWQKNHLVSDAQRELEKEKNEHEKLKDQLARVKRPDFVEEEARDKLFMVKKGEKMVLVGGGGESVLGERKRTQEISLPTWKQWWNIFFADK